MYTMKNSPEGHHDPDDVVRVRSSDSLMSRIQAGPGLDPGRVSMVPSLHARLCLGQFLFEAFGFVVSHEAIDEGSELAIHDFGELVDGQADAVIGDAVLRIIVRANFLGAVTGFDLAAALGADGGLLLFEFHFVETRAQDAHGLGAIFDLRFFVLLRDDQAAGNVRDAHGGVGGVDGLAAGAGRAEGVDAQILGFDLDVDFVGFGKNGDGGGGSVNAALGFRGGHALHAMHAAFVFQLGIDFVALDGGDDFLHAAHG